MGSSTGKLTTKAIAVIVIVAMLDAVGLSPVLMVLITGMVFVVWLCARRAQAREVERIFDFYIAADAILREEERRWYGFEITEVIEHVAHPDRLLQQAAALVRPGGYVVMTTPNGRFNSCLPERPIRRIIRERRSCSRSRG